MTAAEAKAKTLQFKEKAELESKRVILETLKEIYKEIEKASNEGAWRVVLAIDSPHKATIISTLKDRGYKINSVSDSTTAAISWD